jgi:hypothetical protein
MFTAMRPGQSVDEAIAEYDQVEVEPQPEPVAAAPEPVVEPESVATAPEPVVVAAPEPAPVVVPPAPVVVPPAPVAVPPAPVAAEPPVIATPAIAATAAPADVMAQPTWSVMAPDPDQVGAGTPEWPSQQPTPGLPFLGRPAVPTGGVDALWAASSQQVDGPSPTDRPAAGGVQDCVSCGLSLSATARFCRRCGSAQHH